MPSQLPASHAEDASAGLGMAFLVISGVQVGSLDGAELSCVHPPYGGWFSLWYVWHSLLKAHSILKARMMCLFITTTNNKVSADVYHRTMPHKC